MRTYKSLLKFIQLAIVAVILPRVASFIARLGSGDPVHNFIALAFALSLGLGTVATSYFSNYSEPPYYDEEATNYKEVRRRQREAAYFAAMNTAAPYARRSMLLFAFLDGGFNLADSMISASLNGLLNIGTYGNLAYLNAGAAFLFGISPTVISVVLSKLMTVVDRVPADFERTDPRVIDWTRTILGNLGLREYNSGSFNTERSTPRIERSIERSENSVQNERVERPRDAAIAWIRTYVEQFNAWPTVRQVARETGVSLGTVANAFNELRNAGQ